MKISLAIISSPKDLELTQKLVDKYGKYFDEVCVTTEGDHKIKGAKVSNFKWCDDFAKARNFNFKQCTGDWIMWLDADDDVGGLDNIRELIDIAEEKGISGFATLYKYAFDENGNCRDEHWKMQILKNDGHFEWKGAIHEDPIKLRAVNWTKVDEIVRIHNAKGERVEESSQRNLRILEKEHEKDPKEPRTMFYLGRTYLAMKEYQKCIDILVKYLETSGWDTERYEATLIIGQCFFINNKYKEALVWYNNAVLEKEEYPDAFIYKGICYMQTEDWNKAITNFETAMRKKTPEATTFFNPLFYKRDLFAHIALACMYSGRFEEAVKYIQIAKKADDKNKEVDDIYKLIAHIYKKTELGKSFNKVIKELDDRGKTENAKIVLSGIPEELQDSPYILHWKRKLIKPKKWGNKEIAIYCGNSPETWTPESMDNGGVGGSETAVIEITRRLAKKGWKITVYNRCDVEPGGKEFDGVLYKNYWDFNFLDEFNILWIWRLPELLDFNIKSKLTLLDLHDVVNPLEFTEKRLKNVDKIMVKTKYHRGLLPKVPDEKFEIVGNGISLERFSKKVEKEPYRFIYSSTPNRGLDILLETDIWDKIKEKYPEAELHTYYGFNTFYELEKHNPERMAWMQKMEKLMQKPGVVNHGRVGQQELADDILKSSYWLYPTYFPEIHCCTGDTLIDMPRDHKKHPLGIKIKDLVGKSNFPVYSYDEETDSIVLGTVNWVAKTRENAEIWRLNLDDGTYLEATSDHKIMTREGEYKELKDLKPGESLMPVYMRANKFWQVVFPSWSKEEQQEFLQRRVNAKLNNHKVVSVENTGRKEDVYDMNVEKYHNFGANGVIIHNCITACEMQAGGVIPITSGYGALEETQQSGIKLEGDVYDPEWQKQYLKEIFNLLENKDKINDHRINALSVAKQFSWDKVANEWEKIL